MSNKINSIFNIILSIAVIILFVLHFSGSTAIEGSNEDASTAEFDSTSNTSNAVNLGIYYVNTDSISLNYKFAKELDEQLKANRELSRNKFESEVQKFEVEVQRFREKARFMTQEEGQKQQEQLVVREQELAKLEQDLSERLMEDQEKLNQELRKRILDYIEKDGETRKFKYVLGFSHNENNILVAGDSLDITDEILEGLNAEYDSTNTK